jgi:hypothetical protein
MQHIQSRCPAVESGFEPRPPHFRGNSSRSSPQSHRLFIVYADCAVQQVGHLSVDAAAGHVAVLGHADVGVAEVIGADPGRKTFVVDESGDGLAEPVSDRVGDA